MTLEIQPSGPFNLMNVNDYFGGWLSLNDDPTTTVMVFPVEGWRTSAAVLLQQAQGSVVGEVITHEADQERVWRQALSVLSLDESATDWHAVGDRDPIIGQLQASYQGLRPVLFYSPYEAAAAFIIGHRISIEQGRTIRQTIARTMGDCIQVGDTQLYAFPRPQVLLELEQYSSGLSDEKIRRLHGIAEAALAGHLDRAYLRSLPCAQALQQLRTLRGVGEFFAQAILYRGAGLVDVLPDDDVTKQAVQRAYKLTHLPTYAEVLERAEAWRPYRMWASVLLHVWFRREAGGPQRRNNTRTARKSPTNGARSSIA